MKLIIYNLTSTFRTVKYVLQFESLYVLSLYHNNNVQKKKKWLVGSKWRILIKITSIYSPNAYLFINICRMIFYLNRTPDVILEPSFKNVSFQSVNPRQSRTLDASNCTWMISKHYNL